MEFFRDEADQLERIKSQIETLLNQAGSVLSGTTEYNWARDTWMQRMKNDLEGGNGCTMEDSIDHLRHPEV